MNVFIYFVGLCMVPAYFMSICFYTEAICDDFENILLDIEKNERNHYDFIYLNITQAIKLQNSVEM